MKTFVVLGIGAIIRVALAQPYSKKAIAFLLTVLTTCEEIHRHHHRHSKRHVVTEVTYTTTTIANVVVWVDQSGVPYATEAAGGLKMLENTSFVTPSPTASPGASTLPPLVVSIVGPSVSLSETSHSAAILPSFLPGSGISSETSGAPTSPVNALPSSVPKFPTSHPGTSDAQEQFNELTAPLLHLPPLVPKDPPTPPSPSE